MSFVNLMASDVWSDADISNRVQAIIRSRFSAEDELKAARLARKPDASSDDLAFVAAVDEVIAQAVAAGRDARADNALLIAVLGYEDAVRTVATSEDPDEIKAAQAIIDAASPDVINVANARNPDINPPNEGDNDNI